MKRISKYIWIFTVLIIPLIIGIIIGGKIESIQADKVNNNVYNTNKIAIVNLDEGVIYKEEHHNFARELVENYDGDFVFTGLDDAKKGITEGRYAAYVILPADFSSNFISINTEPLKSILKYEISGDLSQAATDRAWVIVMELKENINNDIGYVYVSSILSEFHGAQDNAEKVLENDEKDKEVLMAVSSMELITTLDLRELELLQNDVEDLDITDDIEKNKEIIQAIDSLYEQYLGEAMVSVDSFKTDSNALNENTATVEGLIHNIKTIYNDEGKNYELAQLEAYLSRFNIELTDTINTIKTDIPIVLEEENNDYITRLKEGITEILNTIETTYKMTVSDLHTETQGAIADTKIQEFESFNWEDFAYTGDTLNDQKANEIFQNAERYIDKRIIEELLKVEITYPSPYIPRPSVFLDRPVDPTSIIGTSNCTPNESDLTWSIVDVAGNEIVSGTGTDVPITAIEQLVEGVYIIKFNEVIKDTEEESTATAIFEISIDTEAPGPIIFIDSQQNPSRIEATKRQSNIMSDISWEISDMSGNIIASNIGEKVPIEVIDELTDGEYEITFIEQMKNSYKKATASNTFKISEDTVLFVTIDKTVNPEIVEVSRKYLETESEITWEVLDTTNIVVLTGVGTTISKVEIETLVDGHYKVEFTETHNGTGGSEKASATFEIIANIEDTFMKIDQQMTEASAKTMDANQPQTAREAILTTLKEDSEIAEVLRIYAKESGLSEDESINYGLEKYLIDNEYDYTIWTSETINETPITDGIVASLEINLLKDINLVMTKYYETLEEEVNESFNQKIDTSFTESFNTERQTYEDKIDSIPSILSTEFIDAMTNINMLDTITAKAQADTDIEPLAREQSNYKNNLITMITEHKNKNNEFNIKLTTFNLLDAINENEVDAQVYALEASNFETGSKIGDKSREYQEFVDTFYDNSIEQITGIQEDVIKYQETTEESITDGLENAKSVRTETVTENDILLSSFTKKLGYTRVGSVANTTVYDYITVPIHMEGNKVENSIRLESVNYERIFTIFGIVTLSIGVGTYILSKIKYKKR